MKTQEEINKTAKQLYLQEDDRRITAYYFTAKVHYVTSTLVEDQHIIDHSFEDLFCFYETTIQKALSEFLRRLSHFELDSTATEVLLMYTTKERSKTGTGIKVEL